MTQFHAEDPPFCSDLWTSLVSDAHCFVHVNWYTFLYVREKNSYDSAESNRRHCTKFSRPGNQAPAGCAPLFQIPYIHTYNSLISISPHTNTQNYFAFDTEGNYTANLFFFTMAQQPLVGQGLLIIEASRSHSDKPHSVELLRTSDQPDAETSTWQHTTFTRDRHPSPRLDSNPQFQQMSGRRPTP
jgi:hypothetical protein